MSEITINLTGTAQDWYEDCACERCRLRFRNDIKNAILLAIELLNLVEFRPFRAALAARRKGLILKNKRLRLPIAEFTLDTLPSENGAGSILALTEIHSLPDCTCTTLH